MYIKRIIPITKSLYSTLISTQTLHFLYYKNFCTKSSISCNTTQTQWKPFVIGITGPSGSGKGYLGSAIFQELKKIQYASGIQGRNPRVLRLSQDSFYRSLTEDEHKLESVGEFNFDHPSALLVDELQLTMKKLVDGEQPVDLRVYNPKIDGGFKIFTISPPLDLILLDGTMILYFQYLREIIDLKIYVETDLDICLVRRITRDMTSRGRSLAHILKQYTRSVKPGLAQYCLPTKMYADIIAKDGVEDKVAFELILKKILNESGFNNTKQENVFNKNMK